MSRSKQIKSINGADWGVYFDCPGCGEAHRIPTAPDPSRASWSFNGNYERPTLSPSILVHPRNDIADDGSVYRTPQCHSFVVDGRIRYEPDSTHKLAGQTVDLPEVTQ